MGIYHKVCLHWLGQLIGDPFNAVMMAYLLAPGIKWGFLLVSCIRKNISECLKGARKPVLMLF